MYKIRQWFFNLPIAFFLALKYSHHIISYFRALETKNTFCRNTRRGEREQSNERMMVKKEASSHQIQICTTKLSLNDRGKKFSPFHKWVMIPSLTWGMEREKRALENGFSRIWCSEQYINHRQQKYQFSLNDSDKNIQWKYGERGRKKGGK